MSDANPNDRSRFIGGSDSAAVMGLSPWATPVELWREKTHRATPKPVDPVRERMFARGKKLEPFILEMLVDKMQQMGLAVEVLATNQRYADPEHPFMSCEVDFEMKVSGDVTIGSDVYTLYDEVINGDCKSVVGFARRKWGEEESEDVPIEYAAQFLHGLGILNRRLCVVGALHSLDDVGVYWVVRDEVTLAAMREKIAKFWNVHVLGDTPPDPIEFDDIKLLFPLDNGQATEATPEIAEKVEQLAAVKRTIKDWEEREDELKFAIADHISPNALLTFEGREIASWKGQLTTRLDAKRLREDHPSLAEDYTERDTVRVLRLKRAKK